MTVQFIPNAQGSSTNEAAEPSACPLVLLSVMEQLELKELNLCKHFHLLLSNHQLLQKQI